jgi:hypothetical protein
LSGTSFYGSIDHFGASVVFHGHAHNGIVEGKTLGMCRSLMSRYLFSRVRLRGSFFCTSCDGNAGAAASAEGRGAKGALGGALLATRGKMKSVSPPAANFAHEALGPKASGCVYGC